MHHEHILRIPKYSLRNIWLLIFPLLRGMLVLKMDAEGLYEWVQGAWKDIAVIGIILVFGFVKWYFSRVGVKDGCITQEGGIVIRYRKMIPIESISVATAERPFYMIPFGAVRFSCDTRAGIFKSTDMKLLLTRKTCAELMSHIPDVDAEKRIKGMPKPTTFSVMLFSALFSSGFSGAVYIAMFFFKGGSIAQDMISAWLSRITETTEKLSHILLLKIPAAAIALGTFFLAAWLLSFIVNLLRYSHFKIIADHENVNVKCGITSRREYRIKSGHINYTDLRQNVIMKLFSAVTVYISCAGYGYDSQHLPVVMPIRRKKDLGTGFEHLGLLAERELEYKPPWTGFLNYLFLPVISSVMVFPTYYLFEWLFPKAAVLSNFFAVMLEIPLVWLVFVKTIALFTSGIALCDDKIVLCCAKWTAFHTVIAERKNIVKVELRQSLLQLPGKKCDVIIWLCGESRSRYRVGALKLKDGRRLVDELSELR